MGKYSVEEFRSTIGANGGLASANRFQVELPDVSQMISPNALSEVLAPVGMGELNLMCTTAQLPGKQLNVLSREIGIQTKSVANGQVFTAVNLTFYLTGTYDARKYFQYWMNCVVSQDVGQPMFAGYYQNYVKDVKMHQLDRKSDSKKLYSVQLIDAFPTQMELIQLNNQAQTAAMEMTISLAYKTYKII
jgi:hypothetical protein|tara:strand:+ start:91 stop:660 length:570 start_codon:yes stop_codon:yes gene_type:complete